jgi:AcrR family transcriptional regulator
MLNMCATEQIGKSVHRGNTVTEEAMKNEKHDRRSERTRRLLGDALNSLMLEGRYADLTVQDILDRANIGRSTFYAHYWDKDDLLASQIEHMIQALTRHVDIVSGDASGLLPSLAFFRHVEEQYHMLYQAFVRTNELELMTRLLRRYFCEHIEQRLRAIGAAALSDIEITVTAQGVVGTFLALLQWWLELEMPLRPEEMDAYFRQLVLPGVQQLLAQGGTASG